MVALTGADLGWFMVKTAVVILRFFYLIVAWFLSKTILIIAQPKKTPP